ncbi:hydroxyacylglutathione hydrolase [Halobacteriovorax sp. HLS]|uniref:hydroxyacylglutathione hydrolase n=1 Tax=Halobacteriovorax sp. HLS TaxID=2234000 RepID=UPI000FD9B138|nr:hydroxyacylglutathione hydrolase [Halobacteriovorax sp. HLS]
MYVHQLYTKSPLRNFSYLVEAANGKAICIDPFDAEQMIEFADSLNLEIDTIINTHEHPDHICGNPGIVKKLGAKVFAHYNAEGKIPGIDRLLTKDEDIAVKGGVLKVMDTPGHTFAHLCLKYIQNDQVVAVFSGDTMFNAGIGHCRLGGEPETFYHTISTQFQNLGDDVILYPGHDYILNNLGFTIDREPSNTCACEMLENLKNVDTTKLTTNMKIEREINTFLRLDSKEIVSGLSGNVSSDKQVFLRLRELRNNW